MSDKAAARKADTARKMRRQVDDIGLLSEKLKGELNEDETVSRFDQFLENVENGWIDSTLDPDDTPYGKPFNVRPRIRKLNVTNRGAG